MELAEVEATRRVSFPAAYRDLVGTPLLPGRQSPRERRTEPALLHLGPDYLELSSPAEIADDIDWLRDPDNYLELDPALGLLPFARSGAGDLFVFVLSLADPVTGQVPVGELWHDDDRLDLLAPDLAGFVVRSLLEAATRLYDDHLADPAGFADELRATIRAHAGLLGPRRVQLLLEVAGRPPRAWTETLPARTSAETGLLTAAEADALIAAELGAEWLDRSRPSSRP